MAQQQQSGSSGGSGGVGQFGDTTFTKVFVGGLAWETQKETMRRYFQQFGEILEAVVITDKNTGRSKGYGFVTFRDPESAVRACVDPSPIIDGRRANCNLASLGATRSRPSTPQHGGRFRVVGSFPSGLQTGGHGYYGGAAFPQPAQYAAFQQGFPYQTYGFSTYSPENTYPPNYYSPYGGAHYPQIFTGPGMISNPALYPYYQYAQTLQGSAGYPQAQNFGLHYPPIMHYPNPASASTLPQQYGGLVSFPTAVPSTVCFAMQQV
ncbi:hypothetical protein SUGI_1160710 [Cryptomeria japonica]|uniref:uncharacterized protein LOC131041469 isoform X2 n=1 Tax=Cryptomeria japonica TaxID=3369 RepID=UPI002414A7D4|nr:uncharacterized protein LOC131041469 isoform X2 [Cryptomeria japonica]GLJ54164.1 hypothetical protein SUGI_1160710 [Cryptomeria japonica]